jgi:hypothetical protein
MDNRVLAVLLVLAASVQAPKTPRLIVKNQQPPPPITSLKGSTPTIVDVAVTNDRTLILENETNSLFVVSSDGRVLTRTNNIGVGTAMLADPIQMLLARSNELWVLDADEPKIASFAVRDGAIAYSSAVKLKGLSDVTGMCRLADKTLVLGKTSPPNTSKLLHVVSADGAVVLSIGESFGPPEEFARLFYGSGMLACLPAERLAVVGSRYSPTVRAFDERGTLRWTVDLPDYRAVSYKESTPGRYTYIYPSDEVWDSLVGLFQPAPGVVAFQVGRRRGRDASKASLEVRTQLHDAATGRLVGTQTDLPVVKAVAGNRLLASAGKGLQNFLTFAVEER